MAGPQRLAYGAAIGLLVGLAPWPLDGIGRGLLGWSCGAVVYLVLAYWLANTCNASATRQRARALDQPNVLLLASMLTVVGVSVAVIVMVLQQVKQMPAGQQAVHIVIGVVALAASWLVMHTLYAFHYAHRYYQEENAGANAQNSPEAVLDFPGKLEPDYLDFLYYAYVIGMTSQVSDVQITSRKMRRITLVHSVMSFGFNMLLLALSINVVAGAMQ